MPGVSVVWAGGWRVLSKTRRWPSHTSPVSSLTTRPCHAGTPERPWRPAAGRGGPDTCPSPCHGEPAPPCDAGQLCIKYEKKKHLVMVGWKFLMLELNSMQNIQPTLS